VITLRQARRVIAGAFGLLLVGADACGPPRKPEIRTTTKSYHFTVTSDPIPPHAREDVVYTVTVKDRQTGQPIELGEGRIFANTIDGARTYDGFVKSAAVGAYSAKLRYVKAG